MDAPVGPVAAPPVAARAAARAEVVTSTLRLALVAAFVLVLADDPADVFRPTPLSGLTVAAFAIAATVAVLRERLPDTPPELPGGVVPSPGNGLWPSRRAAWRALVNAVSDAFIVGALAGLVGLEFAAIPIFALGLAADVRRLVQVGRWERRHGCRLVAAVDRDDPERLFATPGHI